MQNNQYSPQTSSPSVDPTGTVDQISGESISSHPTDTPVEPGDAKDISDGTSSSYANWTKDLQLLLTEMQSLRADFDTKVKYDESKERLIDSLHRELQVYREGFHFKILRPVFIELIAMHDDLGKLVENMTTDDASKTLDRAIKNLQTFQESIEEILHRNGVDVYSVEGDVFAPNKQRSLQVIDTTDSTLDKQVARRLRKGFEYEGKVLRPELVATYRSVSSN